MRALIAMLLLGCDATALPPVTLEDLVPTDHFYRHLERTLDLACVRDLVRDRLLRKE